MQLRRVAESLATSAAKVFSMQVVKSPVPAPAIVAPPTVEVKIPLAQAFHGVTNRVVEHPAAPALPFKGALKLYLEAQDQAWAEQRRLRAVEVTSVPRQATVKRSDAFRPYDVHRVTHRERTPRVVLPADLEVEVKRARPLRIPPTQTFPPKGALKLGLEHVQAEQRRLRAVEENVSAATRATDSRSNASC